MPKIIMEFNLPDEQNDLILAQKGSNMYSILWDFDQWLRGQIKHADKEEFEPVREKLYEIMNDNNFNINEVD